MARKCDLTGQKPVVGNKVSHSNRKTKRRFLPNLHVLSLFSQRLNRKLRLKISIKTLRIVEKKGGIDNFLLEAPDRKLTTQAMYYKKQLLKHGD